MSLPALQFEHVNLPARDPEALARWYARTLGLTADGCKVRGAGTVLVFEAGVPLARAPEVHLGFRAPSLAALEEWAARFEASMHRGGEFASFRVADPEGNCVEFYASIFG